MDKNLASAIKFIQIITTTIIIWGIFGYPVWRVWASQKLEEVQLQQVRKEQQIRILKAQGRLDVAELNKKAAVLEVDLYLKWECAKIMEERPDSSVIYGPTEPKLPI